MLSSLFRRDTTNRASVLLHRALLVSSSPMMMIFPRFLYLMHQLCRRRFHAVEGRYPPPKTKTIKKDEEKRKKSRNETLKNGPRRSSHTWKWTWKHTKIERFRERKMVFSSFASSVSSRISATLQCKARKRKRRRKE